MILEDKELAPEGTAGEETDPKPEETTDKPDKEEPDDKPGTSDDKGGVDWNVSGPFFQKKYQDTRAKLDYLEKHYAPIDEKPDDSPQPGKNAADDEVDPQIRVLEDRIVNRLMQTISQRDRKIADKARFDEEGRYSIGYLLDWAQEQQVPQATVDAMVAEVAADFPNARPSKLMKAAQDRIISRAILEAGRTTAEQRAQKDKEKVEALKKAEQPKPGNAPEPQTTTKSPSAAMREKFKNAGETSGAKFLSGKL